MNSKANYSISKSEKETSEIDFPKSISKRD